MLTPFHYTFNTGTSIECLEFSLTTTTTTTMNSKVWSKSNNNDNVFTSINFSNLKKVMNTWQPEPFLQHFIKLQKNNDIGQCIIVDYLINILHLISIYSKLFFLLTSVFQHKNTQKYIQITFFLTLNLMTGNNNHINL